MKPVHFFKAKSRLGLKNKPIYQAEYNIGVENGPDAILSAEFLAKFPGCQISEFEFSKPAELADENFDSILGEEIGKFREQISHNLAEGEQQVVIGGDHCVTLPSVLALIDRVEDANQIGYIQFDSHGDMNLAADSPTGNFHGMYVRAMLDKLDIPEIEALVSQKLLPQNMLFIGNLDLDKEERKYFESQKIKNLASGNIVQSHNLIQNFIKHFPVLHVSFDIDAMDKTEAPATGIPAERGLHFQDIEPILKIISEHPNLSLDLVEVNPRKEGADQTIKLARQIIATILHE